MTHLRIEAHGEKESFTEIKSRALLNLPESNALHELKLLEVSGIHIWQRMTDS